MNEEFENESIEETTNVAEDMKTMTHIIKNYYMGADDNQYILKEIVTRTKRGTSESYQAEATIGFYTSVSGLIKGLARLECRRGIARGEMKELFDCIDFFENFENQIDKLIRC